MTSITDVPAVPVLNHFLHCALLAKELFARAKQVLGIGR